ncbi:MAG TPA: membrane protein insertion efficiency factor YidD [Rhizomicrobium sp.]|nr:membrane protein insertion efficiency factor YidD [Rhizomicrobium sp.]
MMSPFETMRTVLTRFVTGLLCAPIHFYRHFISPLAPPSCRFQPSCSANALEAIKVHGPARGLFLAARRLSRCHPVSWLGGSSGLDPVPLCKHPRP